MYSNMSCGLTWKMEVMMRDDNNWKAILFYFKPFSYIETVYILLSELLQLKRETYLWQCWCRCPLTFTCRENFSKILEPVCSLLLVNCYFIKIAVNCFSFLLPKRVLHFLSSSFIWHLYHLSSSKGLALG